MEQGHEELVKDNYPGKGFIWVAAIFQLLCILLIVRWGFKQEDYAARRGLVIVQLLYVIINLLTGAVIDKGGYGAAVYDAFFIYPCIKYMKYARGK